jgi:hypothetical protein
MGAASRCLTTEQPRGGNLYTLRENTTLQTLLLIVLGCLLSYSVGAPLPEDDVPDWYGSDLDAMAGRIQDIERSFPDCQVAEENRNRTEDCIRNDLGKYFPADKESLAHYESGLFTADQQSAINMLRSRENILLGDVMFTKLTENDNVCVNGTEVGGRQLAIKCAGVLSATCDDGGRKDWDVQIVHYPPNSGPIPTDWGAYGQLVYSLDQSELHRVWYKCQSTTFSKKKELVGNHGLYVFAKTREQASEVWIKKQAVCCFGLLCSYTDW